MSEKRPIWDCHEPVNLWFELSYAEYLTIPRSVLQAMPQEWQKRFAQCLFELDDAIDWRPESGGYWCYLRDCLCTEPFFCRDGAGAHRAHVAAALLVEMEKEA